MDELACHFTSRRTSHFCLASRTQINLSWGLLPNHVLLTSTVSGGVTEYLVALLHQHGVGQQVNGTRLSTRGRATRRGGCPVYTHATHCVPHEAVLTP
jgi:hypothetical protein